MLRWIAPILLAGCLLTPLGGQEKQAPNPPEPKGHKLDGKTPPVAATQYPLDAFTEFSAVMLGSLLFDDEERSFHVYRSGQMFRMEGSEGVGYYLTDLKSLTTYHVWDKGCVIDDHVYFRAAPWAAASRPGAKVERTAGGEESIDGHPSKIDEITITSPELTEPMKLKLWEASDLQGFPVKIEALRPKSRNKVILYKNVFVGSQDPTLFLHPKSCDPPMDKRSTVKKPSAPPKPKVSPAENPRQ